MDELTRPIVGIENRTAQEVFDIMCARLTALSGDKDLIEHFTGRMLASKDAEIAALREQVKGLREVLTGVVSVADRETVEFIRARAALESYK